MHPRRIPANYDPTQMPRRPCSRCPDTSPEFYWQTYLGRWSPECRRCRNTSNRRWRATPHGRLVSRRTTPARAQKSREYAASPAGKLAARRYGTSPLGRITKAISEYRRNPRKTPQGRASAARNLAALIELRERIRDNRGVQPGSLQTMPHGDGGA